MILVIAGPTASGKTDLAIRVAEAFDAVVVSADAMQVYRRLDIGTGKASPQEQARVRHFGIDVVDVDASFDAADFVRLADRVMAEHARVVVAGGTTLYLRALLRGLVQTPTVDRALRAELEALADPHAELARVDPTLAARLHPNDRVRIVRGIEVFRQSGERLSDLQGEHAAQPDRVVAEALWLDRDDLGERIDARVLDMMARGYVDEVRDLLAEGYDRSLKPLQSLGYRHVCAHVLDGLSLEDTVRLTQRDTRRFARKQRTWMRGLAWPRVTDDAADIGLRAAERAFGQRPG